MKNSLHSSFQIKFTLLVTVIVWGLLIWQHFNGGVPNHYILHRSDLAAISNWWGAVLLPGLSWFLVGWIVRRESGSIRKVVVISFVGALLYGIGLSVSYSFGLESLASLMGPALLILALLLPIYRPEYYLGFVLGMSYTFGAVLPTVFALIVAVLSAAIYHLIRPIPFWLWGLARNGAGKG
ncbi:hypothetical protein G0Q06_05735 [Puniceicoccales bacterium CK1056]|uniref:Uncharacterized protein n=1 Tax=Oceanipulchritudo coccoides TaxID=2706888 RepID=A0A6B2M2C0_9BACT|nr:hypothetical protein [Oceanipulchritudo coccoides]NDV61945.1 hypothetical protein [Oceanipulchritudo coccoides]